eukprot:TRINITY_DN29535_c0_g1_i1.p1 TRINITY_DN29535_c0_g1~~TRINITY_DN29535_c0_g1_i1.p1  ORF type:complete len:298 (+),score=58.30 TRINITY_DN29535_c0_g1_i1:52-894(+)
MAAPPSEVGAASITAAASANADATATAADSPAVATAAGGRRAFVSLLTSDDFLMAIQALVASLKATGTSAPLLLLHTTQVSRGVLARLRGDPRVELREVEAIANPHKTDVPGWINSGFTKLRVWEQDDFEKLVYIDADCVVLESVDELFERPCPAFCPDVFPPDRFNAGVMVLEPSRAVFADMLREMQRLPSHDGGDTGFLNAFYPNWYTWPAEQRLPFRYNALRTMYWFTHANPGYWDAVKPIKILHFCSSPKPWDPDAKKGDLEQLWWQHYLRSQIPF